MEINFTPSLKQDLIFEYFDDVDTTEVLYGGAAAGGKSYGSCAFTIIKCLQYPGIRVGLCRNELTTLKKTTIVSLMEVLSDWGLKTDEHYKYNSTTGEITFENGSKIICLELRYLPSDPNYTRLGGQLLTFGIIDEAGEVDEKGKQILQSRLGRWMNVETGVKPFLLMTCNPSKNFLYRDFYLPSSDNTLPTHRKFIQSLVLDNPFINDVYVNNLHKSLSNQDKERLINGNWDYDDDPNCLMEYPTIMNIFIDKKPIVEKPKTYISADIAFTSDNAVIMVWEDLTLVEIIVNPEGIIEDVIRDKAKEYKVFPNNISYDSDGVGKYLMNYLKSAKPIVNNGKPLRDENYENLKTQLYFKLGEVVNSGELKVLKSKYDDKIIEELQQVKHKPSDRVGKIGMVNKGDVKRMLGRSPDFSDAMAYRMIFEIKVGTTKTFRFM
jgi:hypothetical protein